MVRAGLDADEDCGRRLLVEWSAWALACSMRCDRSEIEALLSRDLPGGSMWLLVKGVALNGVFLDEVQATGMTGDQFGLFSEDHGHSQEYGEFT